MTRTAAHRGGAVAIRPLGITDVADYRTIRLASLRNAPDAFGSVYETTVTLPIETFAERLTGAMVLGAYARERIVGTAAFSRETGEKERHKGVLKGVYVEPDARGQGVAEALITGVIDHAREIVEQLTLTVVQGNEAAIALYRKLGFEIYGIEPRARKNPGGYVDKVLMVLDLRRT
jgi:ribosomal protein S18 acetylase RimI-like enzyme